MHQVHGDDVAEVRGRPLKSGELGGDQKGQVVTKKEMSLCQGSEGMTAWLADGEREVEGAIEKETRHSKE